MNSLFTPRRFAFLCLLGALGHGALFGAAARKPNFLFVYTDDQRWDTMSVVQKEQGERARYPFFQTPAMDRVAAEGVRFRNAFATMSLCAPSRAAYLTGRYNHANGVANNHTFFPENSVTHASLLRAAGYKTAYIGKWHMGGQTGQRPGFDYSASFVGQGKYFNCPVEINGSSTPTTGWIDDVSTDFAIEFMKQNRGQPFAMVVGFKSPHGPRGGENLPARLRDRFAGGESRSVPNLQSRAIYHPGNNGAAPVPGKQAGGPGANAAILDYLRHIAGADDNLGRLLKTLDDLGLTDDTVVVAASDNGYYLGEHGLGDKRSLYEESLRIPMLVRYPRLFPKGKVVDEIVLNIDLAPTFLELGGVAVPAAMQGKSWVPLLTGKNPVWRQSFLAEYFYERNFNTPTIVGIRTANAKLVKYPGHPEWTEVFDLALDSYEMKNLAADSSKSEMQARLSAEFDAQVKATGYVVPADADQPGDAPTGAKAKGKKKKAGAGQ